MGTINSLKHYEDAFAQVGWFIPPYISMGFLSQLAADILRSNGTFGHQELERRLEAPYDMASLASMVCNRYPIIPVISDYHVTIGESVKAHFLGLHHVAVAGLIPVIEGAGRTLLQQRGLTATGIKNVFTTLANDCKREVTDRNIGAVDEIHSMLDSFSRYTSSFLYVDSTMYPLIDKTNRHGITHGAYRDTDYGSRLNFYKTIGAVDFLAFVSSMRARMYAFAPDPTVESERLSRLYFELSQLSHSA